VYEKEFDKNGVENIVIADKKMNKLKLVSVKKPK
jgi:hypothetical protein